MSKERRRERKATLFEAIIPIISTIAILMYTILVLKGDIHIPLVLGSIITALTAVYKLGFTWKELEEGVIQSISNTMQSIIILCIIGMIMGVWILSGIVPTLIFYGLKLLSPSYFILASFAISSIVSLATGSSWTTAGTIGAALMGIGAGLGIPRAMVAGAIISGSYFGDKMSPLSDTTNLAPAVAGSTLVDHIKHMIYTTGVSYIISVIGFGIMGISFIGKELKTDGIQEILDLMSQNFNITPVLILVPVLVIVAVAMRVPAIPGLIIGTVLGIVAALFFQNADIGMVLNVLQNGTISETGNQLIDELFTRGGLQSMMWVVSLILCSMTFGGLLEKAGMLETISKRILRYAKSVGSLVTATILTCILTNMLAGDQYLAIVLPGRMFKEEYHKKGLAPRNLSRCLEDAGTLTSPLIPWNSCAAGMSSYLNTPTMEYLPYCLLNLINPIISIIFGYTGITMMKLEDDPSSLEYRG